MQGGTFRYIQVLHMAYYLLWHIMKCNKNNFKYCKTVLLLILLYDSAVVNHTWLCSR